MTRRCNPRGGAPVGHVGDLGAAEAAAVRCFRLWARDGGGKDEVHAAFTDGLGTAAGGKATEDFATLMELCARHGRRPLVPHHFACTCLGADEACLANFIAAAMEGAREDAMLLATLMVRPDCAPMLTALARDVGLALYRVTLRTAPGGALDAPERRAVLH